MIVHFEKNEFTTAELLTYVRKSYGRQINGSPFTNNTICNWAHRRKIPELYGGHKILKVERYIHLHITVYTIEGLNREILEDLEHFKLNLPTLPSVKSKRPWKQRTNLYYQFLEKAGKQYTKKTKQPSTLPDNWKEIGIKQTQLTHKRKKHVK